METKLFDQWTLDNAKQAVGSLKRDIRENKSFYEGDHWQNGEGWIGPRPAIGDRGYDIAMGELERGFVSLNVIGAAIDRRRNGTVGREPTWRYALQRALDEGEELTQGEQALIDEAEAAMTPWWNDRGIHKLFLAMVPKLLWGERATLRIFIPTGLLQEFREVDPDGVERVYRGIPAGGTMEEALDLIYVNCPELDSGRVIVDEDTQARASAFVGKRNDRDYIEMSYVRNGETIFRIMDGDNVVEYGFQMAGRLWMHEVEHAPMITEQVRRQQRALNLAESVTPRNVVTGGFLERILLNAQMPGEWVDDPDSPERGMRFVPSQYHTGPGTTNFVTGIPVTDTDAMGNERTRLSDPNVVFRDPVDPVTSIRARNAHREGILESVDQLHILIAGEALASGYSREQARGDYEMSLEETSVPVNEMGRWLMETVLFLAEFLSGQTGRYSKVLRCDFTATLNPGPISADEQRQNVESAQADMLPLEYAMARNGVQDVDIAIAKINAQPRTKIKLLSEQVKVVNEIMETLPGITFEKAATAVQMDPKMIALLTPTVETTDERLAQDVLAQ